MRSIRDRLSVGLRAARARARAGLGMHEPLWEHGRGRALILMYHRVLPDDAAVGGIEPGMYVRESTFDRHLRVLAARFRVVTLGRLLDDPPRAGDRPVAVVTFDDGWRDNLEFAWPLLKAHGARATIFLVRDWIASSSGTGHDFMSPADVRGLADEGMEFGAHTIDHPRLAALDDRHAAEQMRASREAVSGWTGKPCTLFAYPYGDWNAATSRLASELFRGAVIVGGGWWRPESPASELPRVAVHDDMTSSRSMFDDWILDPLRGPK